jgi:hypothetical protein
MAEKVEHELGKITVKYICDKCGEGEMKSLFPLTTLSPMRYYSVCQMPKCGFGHDLLRKYPYSLEIIK